MKEETRLRLIKEEPILCAEIRALFQKLDSDYHLEGALIPISFGFDDEALGSYTPPGKDEEEHFYFSLNFIGYCLENQIPKSDREDLYKHEYAHYMAHNMSIPKEYLWQSGTHGSAWKYCCSLIGAVPSPTYRFGESLKKQNYHQVLRNPINDKTVPLRDRYQQEKAYQSRRNSLVRYEIGDEIKHPKFGIGIVESIDAQADSVTLTIRFCNVVGIKQIDQKWLLRASCTRVGDRNKTKKEL